MITENITIEWPMVLPSAANLREHWRVRHKRVKAQRNATKLALLAHGVSRRATDPFERLAVRLVRVGTRKLDDDNLAHAFKAVRDEIAAFFGVDDGDERRIRWEYAQAKGKPSMVRIDFAIESRDDVRARVERNAARVDAVAAATLAAFGGES